MKLAIYRNLFFFISFSSCKQHQEVRRPISPDFWHFHENQQQNKKLVASEKKIEDQNHNKTTLQ
jgi:hypothetical protein